MKVAVKDRVIFSEATRTVAIYAPSGERLWVLDGCCLQDREGIERAIRTWCEQVWQDGFEAGVDASEDRDSKPDWRDDE